MRLGDLHAHGRRQRAHRFREAGTSVLHQKRDGAAVLTTTKTVIELFGGTDSKGRRLFLVERAKAKQVGTALSKLYVASNHVDDVDAGQQLLDKGIGYQGKRGLIDAKRD